MPIPAFRIRISTIALAVGALTGAAAPDALADAPIDFNRDVRPILSDNCFACHGPDAAERKADLRLDLREAAILANPKGRTAIVPGQPDASELVRRIRSDDPEKRMPPANSHKTLTVQQKQTLAQWIEQGAEYGEHWAFVTPSKPKPPVVKQADWARNPIDAFVLAQLDASGIAPAPEADRQTLIRRVSYDLTGLPPTLAEIDAFVNDKSPRAYEAMVDRYLAQPAFGERMTLAWMDAARYGDSSVFHADGPRDMWAWRDWVIRSYNDNMPFDRFTIEQLAGDLLPEADTWQRVASGFNRNHGTTDEGGVIAEEARVDYVVDRVKTTSNVWLGLSMECAQCHDHKYDPISQHEYFAFYAFFNQTEDPGMQSRKGNQAPMVSVNDPAKEAEADALAQRMPEIERRIAEHAGSIDPTFAKWVADETAKLDAGAEPELPGDMLAHFTLDESAGAEACDAINADRKGKVTGKPAWQPARAANGFATSGGTFISFPADTANFDRTDAFSYGCWVKPNGDGAVFAKMNDGNGHRGYDLYLQNGGRLAMHLIHRWSGDAIKVGTEAAVKKGEWAHVFVTYDGSSKAAGVRLYINGVPQDKVKVEADSLKNTTAGKAPFNIGRRHNGAPFNGLVDDVRVYGRALTDVEVARLAGADPLRPILATAPDQRTDAQLATLRTHYLNAVDENYPKLLSEKETLAKQIAELRKPLTTVMVMKEQGKPRDTFLLMRGQYDAPDKDAGAIAPAVPAALGALGDEAPRDRLGLARWLVNAEHPLTARVAVNRYWSMFFGQGLVGTVMDFGAQGDFPTHPELLDWLAVDFVESGWDRKRMIKQILMSATYRQSPALTQQLAEVDPENRLLARGPRFRLQGEFIRDTALAVGGLLVDDVGGPGVKPYQPPGLWNEVALSGNVRFVQDKGENLYRKSMYIYWKRSAPHPGMLLLDAPTREKCTVQRPRTNTPLQALYTMNDTQFIEAARALAERVMTQAPGGPDASPEARITLAHRLATAREPSARVVTVLTDLYRNERSRFEAEPDRAKALLAHGEHARNEQLDPAEHAAWTVVASAILNMDATLTRN